MVANYLLGPWDFPSLVKPSSSFFQATPLISLPSSRPGFKGITYSISKLFFFS
ncbi:hypothetical protein LINGRAPRIM_LOCUS2068 [Linum grandiflorum]